LSRAGRPPLADLEARGAIEAIRSDLNSPARLLPGSVPVDVRVEIAARLAARCSELAALIPQWNGPLGQAHALGVALNAHRTAMAAVAVAVAEFESPPPSRH
jgi:hypothetical protein